MNNPWKTKSKETKYSNNWIAIEHHEVITPAGTDGVYGVIHFKNTAIGIIPLDNENNTWIVGQYRYPIDEYSWEIPEGGGPKEKDPLESAKRELLEETGIIAQQWEMIQRVHLSNSASDEVGLIYIARGLRFSHAEPEETEDLMIKKIHVTELIKKVDNGEITDSLSVMAALHLKIRLLEGNL